MVYTRVKALRKNKELPEVVKKATRMASDGASVTFYIFDSGLTTLKAQADRSVLTAKKPVKEFRDKVRAARKELKG